MMDTFSLSDEEAVGCGWVERMDKQMQRKKMCERRAAAKSSRRSSEHPPDPTASRLAAWDRHRHRAAILARPRLPSTPALPSQATYLPRLLLQW
jgi:hypothetical protein